MNEFSDWGTLVLPKMLEVIITFNLGYNSIIVIAFLVTQYI